MVSLTRRAARRSRTPAEQQVAELLHTARTSLSLSTAFLSRLDGTLQHLEVVDSTVPLLFPQGGTQRQSTSFCQAVLDGRLPQVIPDVTALPEARRLPAARIPRIRSFVSVPVVFSDGSLYGTFCAAGLTSDRQLQERDRALLDVLARAAAVVLEPEVTERRRRAQVRERLAPVLAAGGPQVVLQPIVDLASGVRVGAEALSRFPADWQLPPDVCFQQAHSVGQGDQLEVQALAGAAAHLEHVDGYVAVNVSPSTLMTPRAMDVLARLPLRRVLLELSEHEPVQDYDALGGLLAPLRAEGLRLAIDDVGAGFASLRHIVLTAPDVLKIDRTLVAGVADDPVLGRLVGSITSFAHGTGARVVAEGIETARDAQALRALEVDFGQGWFFGRPGPAELLGPAVERRPVPSQREEPARYAGAI